MGLQKALGNCKSCNSEEGPKPNANKNRACSKSAKPSRKTLLRIRYYEMKVQMGDFCGRMFHRMTFQHFRAAENALPIDKIEEKVEQAQGDNAWSDVDMPKSPPRSHQRPKSLVQQRRSHTPNNRTFIVRSHTPNRRLSSRRAHKTNSTFEADDEESELEPGEVPEQDHLSYRRKRRGRERERMRSMGRRVKRHSSQSAISAVREEERTQRKQRSSLTKTKSLEKIMSDLAVGGSKQGEPAQESNSADEKLSDKEKAKVTAKANEATRETKAVADEASDKDKVGEIEVPGSTAELKTEALVQTTESVSGNPANAILFPDRSHYKKMAGHKKSFWDHLIALSNRRRTMTPGPHDVTFGFKIIPVTGSLEGRRQRPEEDDFNRIFPTLPSKSGRRRSGTHQVPMGGGFIEGRDKMKYARLSNLPVGRNAKTLGTGTGRNYVFHNPELSNVLKRVTEMSEALGKIQSPLPSNTLPFANTMLSGRASTTTFAPKRVEEIKAPYKFESDPLSNPIYQRTSVPSLLPFEKSSAPTPQIRLESSLTPPKTSSDLFGLDREPSLPGNPSGFSVTTEGKGLTEIDSRVYVPQTHFTAKFYSLLKDSNYDVKAK